MTLLSLCLLLLGCQQRRCETDCATYQAGFMEAMDACGLSVPGLAPHACDLETVETRLCELDCMRAAECAAMELDTRYPYPDGDGYAACVVACGP